MLKEYHSYKNGGTTQFSFRQRPVKNPSDNGNSGGGGEVGGGAEFAWRWCAGCILLIFSGRNGITLKSNCESQSQADWWNCSHWCRYFSSFVLLKVWNGSWSCGETLLQLCNSVLHNLYYWFCHGHYCIGAFWNRIQPAELPGCHGHVLETIAFNVRSLNWLSKFSESIVFLFR